MKKKQKAPGKRDIKSGNTITINGTPFSGVADVITASAGQLTIGGAPSFPALRVGIATNAPSAETTLHVQAKENNFGVLVDSNGVPASRIGLHAGTAKFASVAKNAFFINGAGWNRFDTASGAYLEEVDPAGNVTFHTAPSAATAPITWHKAMVIGSDGRVGIGGTPFTSGAFQPHFTVHGDIRVRDVPVWDGPDENDLTWGAGFDSGIAFDPERLQISREGSSLRYKENVRPHNADFAKILSVESKVFHMREGYGVPGVDNFGYIAEELHEAGLKDLVIYDRQGRPDGVKYKKVVLYVNEVVKAQQKMIEALQAEVAELKKARRPRARRKTNRKRAA